ncbi:transglycosylase SLT domain-containing protein [Candidatus Daviesbacteria bacterium]|nr:transglycosylase SLT domain-containing protein [Candidatus Daviesbacteria bacterium]
MSDDGSSEGSSPPQLKKHLTRRQFLGATVLGGALGAGMTKVGVPQAVENTFKGANFFGKLLGAFKNRRSLSTNRAIVEQPRQQQVPSQEVILLSAREVNEAMSFFGLNPQNKDQFINRVGKEIVAMANRPFFESEIKQTLVWQDQVKTEVQVVCEDLPSDEQEQWVKLMLGLIFVESKGDLEAASPLGAQGLCQIKDDRAKEIYRKLKKDDLWPKEEYNLLNPQDNIRLAIYILRDNNPIKSLSLAFYNLGSRVMINSMQEYAKSLYRQDPSLDREYHDVNTNFTTWGLRQGEEIATTRYARQFNISFYDLLSSKPAKDALVKRYNNEDGSSFQYGEDDLTFVDKVIAASIMLFSTPTKTQISESVGNQS